VAYKNLLNQSCASRAEVFKRFRDFVCARNGSYDYSTTGIGWTYFDSSYATDENTVATNDWFVIYSPGEGGADDLFYKVTLNADGLSVAGYLSWNAAANTGITGYGVWTNFAIADTDVPYLWIYGDLDQIIGISRKTDVSADYMPCIFGKMAEMIYPSDIFSCSVALTAGTDVVIPIAAGVPASILVGQKIFIRDSVNVARITITAKTADTVTASLATNFLAGAKLSADIGYFTASGTHMGVVVYSLITNAGTKAASIGIWGTTSQLPGLSPEIRNGDSLVVPIYSYDYTIGYTGQLRHIFKRHTTGLTDGLLYGDVADNTAYRAFTLYSAFNVVVREV